MNKKDVVSAYRVALQQLLADQQALVRETAKIVRDAPGSNVTRSDTSRFQYGNQHLGQQLVLEATQGCLTSLGEAENDCEAAQPGALVCLEDEDGSTNWYLILRKANALSVTLADIVVTAISAETPLSKSVLGKTVGEEAEFRGKMFCITEVL